MIQLDVIPTKLKPGLYLIAMPIGNPKDLGLRSLEILLGADVIACEDTRDFQNTMSHVVKHKWNTISHHKNNEEASAAGILQLIQSGKSVCLVSDAGTLNVSDPGAGLVRLLLKNNIYITSIPGPSALTTTLSMFPFSNPFTFYGFLPNSKNEKEKLFEVIKNKEESLLFYESPHRLLETLEIASTFFSERKLLLAREISKTYEEYLYTTIDEAVEIFKTKSPKGEFVLAFGPKDKTTAITDEQSIVTEIQLQMKQNKKSKEILDIIINKFNIKRNYAYDLIEKVKKDQQ